MTEEEERFHASRWWWGRALLEEAGLDDVAPASADIAFVHGQQTFSVRSRSRGTVVLGSIAPDDLDRLAAELTDVELAVFRQYVLETKALGFDVLTTDGAIDAEIGIMKRDEARTKKVADRHNRILRLHAEGRQTYRIAEEVGVSLRTVERVLKASDSATNREMTG